MITVDNLKDVLLKFGFTESSSDVFKKQYQHDASITVDFKHKKITYAPVDDSFGNGEYPTKDKKSTGFVIHRDTTLDFGHNENFVCLVCVHLCLKKVMNPSISCLNLPLESVISTNHRMVIYLSLTKNGIRLF